VLEVNPNSERIRKATLLALALATAALFLWMIKDFLMALLLSAILSGMFYPLFKRLVARFGGKRGLASLTTVAFALFVLIAPFAGFLAIVANQALLFGQKVQPWVSERLHGTGTLDELFELPLLEPLRPYQQQVLAKLGEAASTLGSWSVEFVTSAATSTATFLMMLFIALYAMYFFLLDGRRALSKILYYLPLGPEDEERMIGHFVSVARATIKGTLVIAIAQGGLGGLAFWVVGLEGAALWGTVMAVLSAIPGLGHALVWIPAAIYLGVTGHWGMSLGLVLFCGAVVGSIDNFLRPRLVGRDTKLPDLMILLSTLGGLVLFGAAGFILGPIVAALLVTVWELYGAAFRDVLPPAPRHSTFPPESLGSQKLAPPRSER